MTDEDYIVIRLVTGETILGTLIDVDDENGVFNILHPLIIKSIPPTATDSVEYAKAIRYCPFTDDTEFPFYADHFLFIKTQSEASREYYKKLLSLTTEHENTIESSKEKNLH